MRNLVAAPAVPSLTPAYAGAGTYGSPFAATAAGATVHVEHWHAAENGTPDDNGRALTWLAKARG
jgi:hypothetical protein